MTTLTHEVPLAADLVGGRIDVVFVDRQVDLVTIVRPRTELHRAVLVVERKPANVDRARRDEQAEGNPLTATGRVDDDVGRKLAVNVFVCAAVKSSKYRAIN